MALRIGLLGSGPWGRNIRRTLESFDRVSVAVIPKGGASVGGLDGVIVATQSASHAQVALPYIEAGVPTFIEKPMTTSVDDALRIQVAAQRSGAIVFVGHLYLHHPAFVVALKLLPELGTLRHLMCDSLNDRARTDSSVLWDWLPHDIAMARIICNSDAHGVASWRLAGVSLAEAAVCRFQFGDVPMISTMSWLSPARRRQVTIVGEKATLIFDEKAANKLSLHFHGHGPIFPTHSEKLPLSCELEAFLQLIHSAKVDHSHIVAGISVARAIEAAETSITHGGRFVAI
jgi:predicted dehydrogenase